MQNLKRWLQKRVNIKFNHLRKSHGDRPFTLLDIGIENHSPKKITTAFPNVTYQGLDIYYPYEGDKSVSELITKFYKVNLDSLELDEVPNDHFDMILMAHVIEHLEKGQEVLKLLLTKLKKNGYFYLEFPSEKSKKLPSMKGTLNFYDDPTHVQTYDLDEIKKIFETAGCEIIDYGRRRNWYYILAMPFRMLYSIATKGGLRGNLFWDVLGFADYFYVQKK